MTAQVVFIKKDNTATIACPNCRKFRTVSIQALKGKHQLKVKCSCGTLFDVKLEFRGKFRKETDLEGFYVQEGNGSKAGQVRMDSTSLKPQSVNCRVRDISANGLGLTTLYRHTIEPGNILNIVFTLDNSAQTMIKKSLVVRYVRDRYIGCEFAEDGKDDTAIRFYLL